MMNDELKEISGLLKQGAEAALRAKTFMEGVDAIVLRNHYSALASSMDRKANEIDLRLALDDSGA